MPADKNTNHKERGGVGGLFTNTPLGVSVLAFPEKTKWGKGHDPNTGVVHHIDSGDQMD